MPLPCFHNICRNIHDAHTSKSTKNKHPFPDIPDITDKIVVVDPSTTALYLIKSLLEDNGFPVAIFEHPVLALRHIRKHGAPVIIANYSLPIINGIELMIIAQRYMQKVYGIITTNNPSHISENSDAYTVIAKAPRFAERIIDAVYGRYGK